jgi:hypothetical protein
MVVVLAAYHTVAVHVDVVVAAVVDLDIDNHMLAEVVEAVVVVLVVE